MVNPPGIEVTKTNLFAIDKNYFVIISRGMTKFTITIQEPNLISTSYVS